MMELMISEMDVVEKIERYEFHELKFYHHLETGKKLGMIIECFPYYLFRKQIVVRRHLHLLLMIERILLFHLCR